MLPLHHTPIRTGGPPEIRTQTVRFLRPFPLPPGIEVRRWSERRGSNPYLQLGRLRSCRWTTLTWWKREESNFRSGPYKEPALPLSYASWSQRRDSNSHLSAYEAALEPFQSLCNTGRRGGIRTHKLLILSQHAVPFAYSPIGAEEGSRTLVSWSQTTNSAVILLPQMAVPKGVEPSSSDRQSDIMSRYTTGL